MSSPCVLRSTRRTAWPMPSGSSCRDPRDSSPAQSIYSRAATNKRTPRARPLGLAALEPSTADSGGPLKRDHLPQQAWLVEPGLESALLHGSQNQRWRVQEDSELQPDDSKPKVGNGYTKSGPPAAVRKAHDQHALGAIGCRAS